MIEEPVTTQEMIRARAAIQTWLLGVAYVSFVSVGFRRSDDSVILVTMGTDRPDLVVAQLESDILPAIARAIHEHLEEGRWQPQLQILKGVVRS